MLNQSTDDNDVHDQGMVLWVFWLVLSRWVRSARRAWDGRLENLGVGLGIQYLDFHRQPELAGFYFWMVMLPIDSIICLSSLAPDGGSPYAQPLRLMLQP